jgi:hypothetical protein
MKAGKENVIRIAKKAALIFRTLLPGLDAI